MENKKIKIWKKILLVILVVFILFAIHLLRNFIIILNLENVSKDFANKTNYIANVYSLQSNSVNILKSYNKDGKYLSLLETKVNNINDTRKLTVYKNGNEEIGLVQAGDKKIAFINNGNIVGGGIQVATFRMFGDESGINLLQKLFLSAVARINTEECNNKETFLVEMPAGWKIWVDKENGTIVREINGGLVTERNYEFDKVKDEDIVKPDITDCEIKE